jgi:hypothetical protein
VLIDKEHIVFNPNMKLYTVQHKLALFEILKGGDFDCKHHYTDKDFLQSYDWLKVQMSLKLGCKL